MSQFQSSPCTLSDCDAMSIIWLRAFGGTSMNHLIFPPSSCSTTSQHAWNNRRIEKDFSTLSDMHSFKVTDLETNRPVAWARWGYPSSITPEQKAVRERQKADEDEKRQRMGISPFPPGANVEAATWFFAMLDRMKQKYVKSDECYVLHLLAVDPDYQRRGVGSMLVEHCLARADAEGAKAYLESTQAGRALYLKMGWKDVDRLDVDLVRWDAAGEPISLWVMVREPQSKA